MMDCWSYEPGNRPVAADLHEQITHLLTEIELGHENNLYIVNNQPTAKGELSAQHESYSTLNSNIESQHETHHDEIEHIFTRNPTIPPKKFPKVRFFLFKINGNYQNILGSWERLFNFENDFERSSRPKCLEFLPVWRFLNFYQGCTFRLFFVIHIRYRFEC